MISLRWMAWPAAASCALLAGCGSSADDVRAPQQPPQAPMVQRRAPAQSQTGDVRTQQAQILAQIRRDDPQKQRILMAKFNEKGELGVVLHRDARLDAMRPLTKNLLTRLGRAFPSQDATVKLYAPNGAAIATGTLDGRTGKMLYQPQQRQ